MPRAETDLDALTIDHQVAVSNHLERLSLSPTTLSRPAVSPPHPPGGMTSEFDVEDGSTLHHFTVAFRYSQDETELIVVGIGHAALWRGD